jgi:tetratricopeptide (TPR) repeat protein
MLQQVISVALVTFVAATPPAVSQGIAPGACVTCTTISVPAERVLVATPYTSNSADSANAVHLGYALRDRIAKNIDGGTWRVITTQEMNTNLMTSGYSKDALLPPDVAMQLAHLTSRMFVMTTLAKAADGTYNATMRVISLPGDAGYVVRLPQAPNQSFADWGNKLGDQANIVFKAFADAKQCLSNETAAPAKAVDAANHALKTLPNYGLAEYCLGEMAQAKDSGSVDAQQHFRNALTGDPLSLRAVQSIAAIDLKRNDSTAVVNDFKQMITIAPTDRAIADRAWKVFSAFGRPDAANEVVAQQIALDPTDPDWPDLKGNSCMIAAGDQKDPAVATAKYACAYEAFQTVVKLDPARADTDFFAKIIYVAPTSQDSLVWVKHYVDKYPSSTDPLKIEAQIYVAQGQLDSAVKVVNLLVRIDPTDAKPVLIVANAMIDAKHPEAVLQFVPYFQKGASDNDKNQFVGLLINKVLQPMATSTPRPDSSLITFGQAIIAIAPTGANLLIYANYYVAIGLADQLKPLSDALRANKTCEAAKAEDTLLTSLEAAAAVAATSTTEGIATFGKNYITNLPPEHTFVRDMMTKELKCP